MKQKWWFIAVPVNQMEQNTFSSDQLIKYNYGNVDYWITFSNQTIVFKKALSASSFKLFMSVLWFGDGIRKDACNLS